jgi:hypothetical protein
MLSGLQKGLVRPLLRWNRVPRRGPERSQPDTSWNMLEAQVARNLLCTASLYLDIHSGTILAATLAAHGHPATTVP